MEGCSHSGGSDFRGKEKEISICYPRACCRSDFDGSCLEIWVAYPHTSWMSLCQLWVTESGWWNLTPVSGRVELRILLSPKAASHYIPSISCHPHCRVIAGWWTRAGPHLPSPPIRWRQQGAEWGQGPTSVRPVSRTQVTGGPGSWVTQLLGKHWDVGRARVGGASLGSGGEARTELPATHTHSPGCLHGITPPLGPAWPTWLMELQTLQSPSRFSNLRVSQITLLAFWDNNSMN